MARRTNLVLHLAFLGLPLLAGCDASRPALTDKLRISLRPSFLAPETAVLQITNRSAARLDNLSLRFYSPDTHQEGRYFVRHLAPGETQEVGILEAGWAVAPNEVIELHCIGYRSAKFTTYRTGEGLVGFRESLW